MSAPDTNVKTMVRRHKPVLLVLRALMAAAALGLAGFVAWQVLSADVTPEAQFGNPTTFEPGGEASAAVD